MDLDAQLRGLHNFKTKMEQLLDGGLLARLEAIVSQLDGADTTSGEELKKHVDELAETVTGIQLALEKLPETISQSLNAALKPTQDQLAAVGKLADPAVLDLLDWLARNREGLDLLLTIGETADGTTGEAVATGGGGSAATTKAVTGGGGSGGGDASVSAGTGGTGGIPGANAPDGAATAQAGT